MKCANCGSYVEPGRNFCIRCGCPVEQSRTEKRQNPNKGNGSTRYFRWVVCLAITIAVGSVVYMLSAHGVGIGAIVDGIFSQAGTVRTVYYGDSSKLHIGLTSKITVCGADGDPIDDGGVQLIPQGGSVVGNDDYAILNLKNGGSFSFSDYSNLALGTYCMRVFEGSQREKAYEYPNVVIDLSEGDGETDDGIVFKVSSSKQGLKSVNFYEIEETKQTINVTYENEGNAKGYSNQWACVQIDEEGDDISEWPINKKLKALFDEASEDTRGWTAQGSRSLRVGYAQSAVMLDQLRSLVSIKFSYTDVGPDGEEVDGATGELLDIQTGDSAAPESYFGISRDKRNAKARSAIGDYAAKQGLDLDEASIRKTVEDDESYLVTADDLYVLLNPSESGEATVQLLPLEIGKTSSIDG